MRDVFSLRSLLAVVSVCAVLAALLAALRPPDYHKMARALGRQSAPVQLSDLSGKYLCGGRGQVFELDIASDGTYNLTESGCFGLYGHSSGRLHVVDNVIEFDQLKESGDIAVFSWAYVGESAGCYYLVADQSYRGFLERGYSPAWCLSKEGEMSIMRKAAEQQRGAIAASTSDTESP